MDPAYTLGELRRDISDLNTFLAFGCGNHGCKINPPIGQGTNAICKCSPRDVSERLLELAARVEGMGRTFSK